MKSIVRLTAFFLALAMTVTLIVACATVEKDTETAGKDTTDHATGEGDTTDSGKETTGKETTAEENTTEEETTTLDISETFFTIQAVNGTFKGGKKTNSVLYGKLTTLTAEDKVHMKFSHWENSAGENVGTSKQIKVTVTGDETYTAKYTLDYQDSVAAGDEIFVGTDDWKQGGINGDLASLKMDDTRISLKEPHLFTAGQKLVFTAPVPKESGYNLIVAYQIVKPKVQTLTGDFMNDYEILQSRWTASVNYTFTENTYVMLTIKYSTHGSENYLLSERDGNDKTDGITFYLADEDYCPTTIGSWWQDELTDTVGKIAANRQTSEQMSEFFYLTDPHWTGNTQCSPALINYLSGEVDVPLVMLGGDVIVRYEETKTAGIRAIDDFYAGFDESLHLFSMLGNHDRNGSSNQPNKSERLSEAEAYEHYLSRMEEFGAWTEDGDPNRAYYDDTENKVRYIQFYHSDGQYNMIEDAYTDAGADWAVERIMELDEGWTVVLFTHGFWRDPSEDPTWTQPAKSTELAAKILKAKAEAKADVAIWITGHCHVDHTEVLNDGKGTTLRVVSLNCDSYTHSTMATSLTMTANTVTEQSFSFVQLDLQNKKIYFTRVGAGDDLEFSY